jgi:hypothetical protein
MECNISGADLFYKQEICIHNKQTSEPTQDATSETMYVEKQLRATIKYFTWLMISISSIV